jgi:uncharacterized protein
MEAFDTNIAVYAANADSPLSHRARNYLQELGGRGDVVVCELMLVELFLKLCNPRIFPNPFSPQEAAEHCGVYRDNRNWKLVDSAPVMPDVWKQVKGRSFAFRRIIDVRLGLTLRHHGVTRFATTNVKDFGGLGFEKVWNPLSDD